MTIILFAFLIISGGAALLIYRDSRKPFQITDDMSFVRAGNWWNRQGGFVQVLTVPFMGFVLILLIAYEVVRRRSKPKRFKSHEDWERFEREGGGS